MIIRRAAAAGIVVLLMALAAPASALTPSDPLVAQQWYLDAIQAKRAWDVTIGNPKAVVAVLDIGIDLDHPDLADAIWTNAREVAGNGVDDDGNGYVDDARGWDFVGNDADPSPSYDIAGADPRDLHHGTIVAGIIAARGNNGQGIAGMDWLAKIMPLRVLRANGVGDLRDVIEALRYARANGATIVNLSFVGDQRSTELDQLIAALAQDGILVVAAGGNEDKSGRGNLDEFPAYPICSGNNGEYVLGVAATNEQDAKASFSSYGTCVDLSAPGSHIAGTLFHDPEHVIVPVGDRITQATFTDAFGGFFNGTSYAAPIVAGTASLIRGILPSLAPADVIALLAATADPVANVPNALMGKLGAGRLNAARAVEQAIAQSATAPSVTQSSLAAATPLAGTAQDVVVRVTLRNDVGQFLVGRTVTLQSNRVDDGVTPTSAVTDAAGVAAFTVRASTPGIAELTAVTDGATIATGRIVIVAGNGVAVGVGSLVKGTTSAVYVIGSDGARYAFPDRRTFDSWYADTASIARVDDAVLAAFPLKGLVTMRPGTFLVKIATDPKVYAVEAGGVLRWVPTEAMAMARYGTAWAGRVADVPDAFFTTYRTGAPIGPGEYPNGYLWEHPATGIRAMVADGRLRAFSSHDVFLQNGYQTRDLFSHLVVDLPQGAPISIREPALAMPVQ
ncbi:MAG: S8 family serine peptidase [bacterium]|nr:S8 family serine peptidase [bacterium]